MVVVYYREKCTLESTGEKRISQVWSGAMGMGPQSTSVSLAIIAIYVIKGWYSLTNEAIVKIVG